MSQAEKRDEGSTCRGLDLHIVDGLHEARGGHEEGAVAHPPGSGDDLAPAPVQGLRCNVGIQDLELDIPDGLVTQGPLPGAPLEALQNRGETFVVHFEAKPLLIG